MSLNDGQRWHCMQLLTKPNVFLQLVRQFSAIVDPYIINTQTAAPLGQSDVVLASPSVVGPEGWQFITAPGQAVIVPHTGVYRINFVVQIAQAAAPTVGLVVLVVNGTPVPYGITPGWIDSPISQAGINLSSSSLVPLQKGDVVALVIEPNGTDMQVLGVALGFNLESV